MIRVLALAFFAITLAWGCGGGDDEGPAGQPTSSPGRASPTVAPSSPTGSPSPSPTELSAAALVEQLRAAGLPVGDVSVFDASTDPNELLGRPNQYIGKANFHDTRLSLPSDPARIATDDGGSIEVFEDEGAATFRYEYVSSIAEVPLFAEYDYLHGLVLLRLANGLTPEQAEEYDAALAAILRE